MKLYRVKVLLGRSRDNEVWKENVTAAEIKLLQMIHGGVEAVTSIEHTANTTRSDAAERRRLASLYTFSDTDKFLTGPDLVLKMFGVDGVPLPQEYVAPVPDAPNDDDFVELAEDEEITPVEAPPPVRTRVPRERRAAPEAETAVVG